MATRIVGKRLRYSVRDVLDEQAMAELVRQALAGQTDLGPVGANRLQTILWDDFGDQVLVYLDSVIVKLIKRLFIVSVDFECEQTGRAPLIVTLALGSVQDGAGLVATTNEAPRGHPLLAARWGRIFQETVWAALLGTARTHANERGKVPLSVHVLDGHLRFGAAPPWRWANRPSGHSILLFLKREKGRRDE